MEIVSNRQKGRVNLRAMITSVVVVLEHQMFQTLLEHVHTDEQQKDGIEQSKQNLKPLDTR
jgi:hypothetical protein